MVRISRALLRTHLDCWKTGDLNIAILLCSVKGNQCRRLGARVSHDQTCGCRVVTRELRSIVEIKGPTAECISRSMSLLSLNCVVLIRSAVRGQLIYLELWVSRVTAVRVQTPIMPRQRYLTMYLWWCPSSPTKQANQATPSISPLLVIPS